jgi:serine/tyrosine/threonine adenylyltransferase
MVMRMPLRGWEQLRFDNQFVRNLPGDPNPVNQRRQVHGACFSRVKPTPVRAPRVIGWSEECAALLDLSGSALDDERVAAVLGGNDLLPGMDPFAMCYGGHQFGNWAGQLGDGRAINLGEVLNQRNERWMLQLKGAGPTPYSRTADGLAVLRSSLREFLCSEAMFHLGVPTTRALSLVVTGEKVQRDMFYDGHPELESGAVVCRVARSFTRFGNFQILAARREHQLLQQLVDHTIQTDFPHLGEPGPQVMADWFAEVCRTTAEMIVHWMRVGFVHGVMNTDNMSILGETIDYGPYGWMDNYDPDWTPNTTDAAGRRYCYASQPQIALWNLVQLANALASLFPKIEHLQAGIDLYTSHFNALTRSMLLGKLGLPPGELETDGRLTGELLEILQTVETDMTIFWRHLGDVRLVDRHCEKRTEIPESLQSAYYRPEQNTPEYVARLNDWLDLYAARCLSDGIPDSERRNRMNLANPKFVLRNYLAQQAIDLAETGDYSRIAELLDLLRRPYDEQPGREHFAERRPDWARHRAGCSMLSCSS